MGALGEKVFLTGNKKYKNLEVWHPCSTNSRKTSVVETHQQGEIERYPHKIVSRFSSHTQDFGFYYLIGKHWRFLARE